MSIDRNHDPPEHLRLTLTKVQGHTLVKVSAWYDNEWASVTACSILRWHHERPPMQACLKT